MAELAPVCLFVYTRLEETLRTLNALKQNFLAGESKLYVFSDGAKNERDQAKVQAVRDALQNIDGFAAVELIASETNKGLATSIISGVSAVLKVSDRIIVVEDDLVASPNFLDFMNEALTFYEREEQVQSISGYSLQIGQSGMEIYFQQRPGSWGWATWRNRWDEHIFDKMAIRKKLEAEPELPNRFARQCGQDMPRMLLDSINNRNDSWYVRWTFDHFLKDHYALYPTGSFIDNIGFEPDATHCKGINSYVSVPADPNNRQFHFRPFAVPGVETQKSFLKYFKRTYKLLFRIKLLKTAAGRHMVMDEIRRRTKQSFQKQ